MDLEINDALAMEICHDTSINSRDGWRSSSASIYGLLILDTWLQKSYTHPFWLFIEFVLFMAVRTSQPRRSRADAEAS
ncbi:hypothetical protein YC2023_057751 [Brassica napus]